MLVFFFTAYFYLLQVQANTTSLHFCMCVQSSMHVHSVSNSEIWTNFFLYFSSSSAPPPFCLSVSSTEIWQLYSYYTLSVYRELDLSITALCVWVFPVLKSEQLSSYICLSVCLNWTPPSMVYFLILFDKFLNF